MKKILDRKYGPLVGKEELEEYKEGNIEPEDINFLIKENLIEDEYIKWAQKQYDSNDNIQTIYTKIWIFKKYY